MQKNEKGSHAQKWPRFVATTSELDQMNVASQFKHDILLARAMNTRAFSPNQPRTVQNGARGDECRPEREWPPFVTTTMELDETKGACQLYSWQVAHVRFISDHVVPQNHRRRLEWCAWR